MNLVYLITILLILFLLILLNDYRESYTMIPKINILEEKQPDIDLRLVSPIDDSAQSLQKRIKNIQSPIVRITRV